MAKKQQVTLNGNTITHNGSSNVIAHQQHPPRDEVTDLKRWRLLDVRGRQTWHYLESVEELGQWPQSTADRYFLDLPLAGLPYPTSRCRLTTIEGPP